MSEPNKALQLADRIEARGKEYGGAVYDHAMAWSKELRALASGEAVAVSDHVRKLVGKLDQWRMCMSHSTSYVGEPAGLFKEAILGLARAVDPIYPEPKNENPFPGVVIYTEDRPEGVPANDLIAAHPPTAATQEGVPLQVFDAGPWIYVPTGQNFSGSDLNGAAYSKYSSAATQPEQVREVEPNQVSELLAVIHGDGGHYEDDHGTQQAAHDAIQIVRKMMEGWQR